MGFPYVSGITGRPGSRTFGGTAGVRSSNRGRMCRRGVNPYLWDMENTQNALVTALHAIRVFAETAFSVVVLGRTG